MLAVLVAALALQTQAGFEAGRYEFEERYRALDVAWKRCTDKGRRLLAIPEISTAMASAESGNLSDACLHLDLAQCQLDGAKIAPGDALSLRFNPALIEPGGKAVLRVTWAYKPEEVRPVSLEVGGRSVSVLPGRSLTLQIDPAATNPDLRMNPEAGYIMPSTVDGAPRGTYLSIIKGGKDRIGWLKNAANPLSRALGRRIAQALAEADREWSDPPVIDWLFMAERLDESIMVPGQVDDFPFVDNLGCTFRVSMPASLRTQPGRKRPANVVIAFAPGDGLENRWFMTYGQGGLVKACLAKGWAFVGVRSGPGAYDAVLNWLESVRGLDAESVFVVGVGQGVGAAMETARSARKPNAMALISPRAVSSDFELGPTPTYAACGKLDTGVSADLLAKLNNLEQRGRLTLADVAGTEGEMAVAECTPSLIAFLTRHVAR